VQGKEIETGSWGLVVGETEKDKTVRRIDGFLMF
jgi:hypothetical protein